MARFFRRGTSKIFFVPGENTFTNVNEPEASASYIDISCDIAEITGFSFANSPIEVPDMCSEFVKKIPGEDTADDSELTFYEDNLANPIRNSILTKGTLGYIVLFPYGVSGSGGTVPAAGDEAEVWPVSVARVAREWSAGNEPARYMISLTIRDIPGLHAEVKS